MYILLTRTVLCFTIHSHAIPHTRSNLLVGTIHELSVFVEWAKQRAATRDGQIYRFVPSFLSSFYTSKIIQFVEFNFNRLQKEMILLRVIVMVVI